MSAKYCSRTYNLIVLIVDANDGRKGSHLFSALSGSQAVLPRQRFSGAKFKKFQYGGCNFSKMLTLDDITKNLPSLQFDSALPDEER